jgi:hypothetical protein
MERRQNDPVQARPVEPEIIADKIRDGVEAACRDGCDNNCNLLEDVFQHLPTCYRRL